MIFPASTGAFQDLFDRICEAQSVAELDALRPKIDALPEWRDDLLHVWIRARIRFAKR